MNNQNLPTLEQLQNLNMDFYGVENLLRDYELPYPEKPRQPRLNANPSKEQALQYVNDMNEYEAQKSVFDSVKDEYFKMRGELDILLEEYIKWETGFYDSVPEQYQSKVWNKAYEEGHSGGWLEVYNCFLDLIDIFK